ncbi:MAG: hypothetical protein Q8M65_06525 [Rhodoglobus sp.]|nr:hypothetical protein [Rhodoglobus sp.]
MSADNDDALTWGDETDSSHVDGPVAQPDARGTGDSASEDRQATAQTPAALLITYGILGGTYLIYTLGWVISITRLNRIRGVSTELLSEIMFQFGEFLAIASPVLWFAAVVGLTRGRRPIVRLSWIVVGLLAVLPWPFVLGAWA